MRTTDTLQVSVNGEVVPAASIIPTLSSACVYDVDPANPALTITTPSGGSIATLTLPTLANDKQYLVVAYYTTGGVPAFAVFDNDYTPGAGTSGMRFVHLATGRAGQDVYYTEPGAALTAAGRIVTNLAFGANSGFLDVTPDIPQQVRVTNTGTTTLSVTATSYTSVAGERSTLLIVPPSTATSTTFRQIRVGGC